jgi:hypothetical protein
VVIRSDPPGAEVWLGSRAMGKTPVSLGLPVGETKVTLKAIGLKDQIATVMVAPSKTNEMNVIFAYGSVVIQSEPPGAAVKQDGKVVGDTPYTAKTAAPGLLNWELEANGYQSTNVSVGVSDHQTKRVTVELQKEIVETKAATEQTNKNLTLSPPDSLQTAPLEERSVPTNQLAQVSPAMLLQYFNSQRSNALPSIAKQPSNNSLVAPRAEDKLLQAGLDQLKGIVILGSYQDFKDEGVVGIKGLDIKGPAFLKDHKDKVYTKMGEFLGKPFDTNSLNRLEVDLVLTCRQLDRPVVDIVYPEQEIVDGVIQIVIYEGRIGQILVRTDGRIPLPEDGFLKGVRLKPGEPVIQSQVLKEVARLNREFKNIDVDVAYKQGVFNGTNDVGGTDIEFYLKASVNRPHRR